MDEIASVWYAMGDGGDTSAPVRQASSGIQRKKQHTHPNQAPDERAPVPRRCRLPQNAMQSWKTRFEIILANVNINITQLKGGGGCALLRARMR